METKHTPLPWTLDKRIVKWHLKLRGKSKQVIADVFAGRNKKRANAEFIARACNNHYDLLEACQHYVKWSEGNGTEEELEVVLDEADFMIRAAIAKAEGKENV